ncbi:50S ribosomal protein L34 [Candidatus Roizmanbacteria bacterium RIFCSPHIGHO2_12_FULL_44_10]|uniref:Large ribosomal subunit protein bL34 n=1 Tax=Candidatus Roizmanbacteria bacterium RIFCSPHIGHO2_12_FULL_44_10 TaxID=1802054 RepID=A0A1F7I781_9BACT|nr:MAG: 50S ribosomal protein L34 [Candidatus Roizmanbacteria bacterium RIFCSPHIGHO2_12_FULL_44_10]
MPKRTYQPKKLKRKRKHGFLIKNRTKAGRAVIGKRRKKGRKKLTL